MLYNTYPACAGMNQLYDQDMYKNTINYDVTLNIPNSGQENTEGRNDGYVSADQTYHTPNFGDEEFEIPPLTLPQNNTGGDHNETEIYGNQTISHHPHNMHPPCSQSVGMDYRPVMNSEVSSMNMIEGMASNYNHQDVYMVPNSSSGNVVPSSSISHSYRLQNNYNNSMFCAQAPSGQLQDHQYQHHQMNAVHPSQSHLHMAGHQLSRSPSHSISCSNGLQPSRLAIIGQTQMSPNSMMNQKMNGLACSESVSSSPGSTHTSPGLETSEDSDDSTPLPQAVGFFKRPSPGPMDVATTVAKNIKKLKPQKKKKKRDPNEPQKPVSAYALFFRDTQAAIKGQNPSASFGEVSKIVASMWDGLDAEHKNVYKKKTEAAKKEYLKALAAYRASLVSKVTADHPDSIYENSGSPPISSTSPTIQSLSPLQKKSPLLTSLMERTATTFQNMSQPPVLTTQVWTMHPMSTNTATVQPHQHPQIVHTHQHHVPHSVQLMHQIPTSQMTLAVGARPSIPQLMQNSNQVPPVSPTVPCNTSYSDNMMPLHHPPLQLPLNNIQEMAISPSVTHHQSSLQTCLRNGCPNPAVESAEWDKEYCSSECVVSHCRDVFSSWASSRQMSNGYASVK